MSEPILREVVIIGAGPAGVAAAVQLARHGIRPLVFEKGAVGGLLRTAWFVENCPGFPGGISGPDLVWLLREHLRASGADVAREEVRGLEREGPCFTVTTTGREVRSRAVIVASGTSPVRPDGMEIAEDAAPRVFREVQDLWAVHGARVAVVGSGDAAFDYAIGLAAQSDVVVLVRGESPKCLPLLQERALSSDRVEVRTRTRLRSAKASVDGLVLSLEDSAGRAAELRADYLVLAIGREPADGFVSDAVRCSAAEYERKGELFFVGDVVGGIFRQSSIAAGQGTLAAMRVAAMIGNGGARQRWSTALGAE